MTALTEMRVWENNWIRRIVEVDKRGMDELRLEVGVKESLIIN